MPPLNQRALQRARHALYWARQHHGDVADHDPVLSQLVRRLLTPCTIRLHDLPGTRFPVTLHGGTTLAIVPELARRDGERIIVRGYDETGRADYLELHSRHGLMPGAGSAQRPVSITSSPSLRRTAASM